MVKVSVIIPVTRKDYLIKCLESLGNQSFNDFEIILLNDEGLELNSKKANILIVKNKNPAYRRNLGAKKARGEILAFIDDDAYANKDWMKTAINFLNDNEEFSVVGGPDLLNKNAGFREKISEVLLSNKFLGSGVLAHQNYQKAIEVTNPSSLALCNLFVRKKEFEMIGGFNEKIGYGGEDTEFLYVLRKKLSSRMMYIPTLFIYHKKRDFMLPYLKQRIKFRINNGKMIFASPSLYLKNYKFLLFFIIGTLFLIILFLNQLIAAYLLLLYLFILVILSIPYIGKDIRYLILPFAFALQHIAYYIGILIGFLNIINYNKLKNINRL